MLRCFDLESCGLTAFLPRQGRVCRAMIEAVYSRDRYSRTTGAMSDSFHLYLDSGCLMLKFFMSLQTIHCFRRM